MIVLEIAKFFFLGVFGLFVDGYCGKLTPFLSLVGVECQAACCRRAVFCSFVQIGGTFPVSYTHLDVYKRQLLTSYKEKDNLSPLVAEHFITVKHIIGDRSVLAK